MPDKRIFYLTSRGTTAYRWDRGRLLEEAFFATGQDGAADCGRYVEGARDSLFYVLADLVEEDFYQENIPYVRAGDRRVLLARKIAQRYRDTSLTLTLSLGKESRARQEERILFGSFTNTQQFQPLLEALRAREARLVGVYSVPLVAPLAGRRIGIGFERYLLVSQERAGLRQTFVEKGHVRFSRLGRADFSSPREGAEGCVSESERIQQFLVNNRMLARDGPPLEVVVLAPAGDRVVYEAVCQHRPRLRFTVQDVDEAARRAGLKSKPDGILAEALFLHALAQASRPGEQFADHGLRRFYHLWQARNALIGAGAALCALSLAWSGLQYFEVTRVREATRSDRAQEDAASREYARMQAQFPYTPTPADNLKVLVANYQALLRQQGTPADLMLEVSRALAGTPQIELEKLEWEISAARRPEGNAAEASKAAPQPAPAAPAGGAAVRGGSEQAQHLEISGRVHVQQASDYRGISLVVGQFVEALRARPGIEVVSTRLPFDITAEKSLSGDIGAQRTAEEPRFSVVLRKKLGA